MTDYKRKAMKKAIKKGNPIHTKQLASQWDDDEFKRRVEEVVATKSMATGGLTTEEYEDYYKKRYPNGKFGDMDRCNREVKERLSKFKSCNREVKERLSKFKSMEDTKGEMDTSKIEIPKEFGLNLKVDSNNVMTLPSKNPVNNSALQYVNDQGVTLVPMVKSLQPTLDKPPVAKKGLWDQACSGDGVTNDAWNKPWNDALDANEKKYNFEDNSCMKLFAKEAYKPVIIAGSGPSIKNNSKYLKPSYMKQINSHTGETTEAKVGGRHDIKMVSCLHNFAYFEDNDLMTGDDYYVNLDAGHITVKELTEGGKHDQEWYWEQTRARTLVTTVLACPELLEKWQGKIYFYKTGSGVVKDFSKRVNPQKVPTFSVGGNVLGASLYFAKAILGAGDIIMIGADFCFSYDHKFHGWDSQYDQQFQGVIPATDIYGNRVFTWPSYYNFKCFFEFIAMGGAGHNPQLIINATEGGILGAYPNGNLRHIQQTSLKEALHVYTMHTKLPGFMSKPGAQELVLF